MYRFRLLAGQHIGPDLNKPADPKTGKRPSKTWNQGEVIDSETNLAEKHGRQKFMLLPPRQKGEPPQPGEVGASPQYQQNVAYPRPVGPGAEQDARQAAQEGETLGQGPHGAIHPGGVGPAHPGPSTMPKAGAAKAKTDWQGKNLKELQDEAGKRNMTFRGKSREELARALGEHEAADSDDD